MFNFDDWLAGVETPAEAVTIYQKPGLIPRIEVLKESIEYNQERSLGDSDPKEELLKLEEELENSRTVWYMSPITQETRQAIEKAIPTPRMPKNLRFNDPIPQLSQRATEKQSEAFVGAWTAYQIAKQEWDQDHEEELAEFQLEILDAATKQGAEMIAQSVTYIETADGKRSPVKLTAAQILELQRKIGEPQIGLLVEAMNRISQEVPEAPDPTMLGANS